jgi:uncharacterized protein DUF2877
VRVTDLVAVGFKADAWLICSHGRARVIGPRATSAWLAIGADAHVVWLGPRDEPPHGRAILCAEPPRGLEIGDTVDIVTHLPPWRPREVVLDPARLSGAARRLSADSTALGAPTGFGARLAGRALSFPLDGAAAAADALASACARDDAAAARTAALALLGVGHGLTPSGDDFVGGAFFVRLLLSRAGAADARGWRDAARAVRDHAAQRTHPISAALLGDLLDGEGWAPLHDCVTALGRDDAGPALAAARRLVALGHSSGWDLLAGLLAGAGA